MPLFFQKVLNQYSTIGIWKIEESEDFFLNTVPLLQPIQHPHKRLQHLAGRFLLRQLVPDFPMNAIQIKDTKKPFLENGLFQFSISHCGNYAAAIVSTKEKVGIDIELRTPKIERIAHKFLHSSERAWLRTQAADNNNQKIAILTAIWSAKEALFKWWGIGGVDFSEMMQITATEIGDEGIMAGRFSKGNFRQNLEAQYRQFAELTLCWVQTD